MHQPQDSRGSHSWVSSRLPSQKTKEDTKDHDGTRSKTWHGSTKEHSTSANSDVPSSSSHDSNTSSRKRRSNMDTDNYDILKDMVYGTEGTITLEKLTEDPKSILNLEML